MLLQWTIIVYYNVKFVLLLYDIKGHIQKKQFLNSQLEGNFYQFMLLLKGFLPPNLKKTKKHFLVYT